MSNRVYYKTVETKEDAYRLVSQSITDETLKRFKVNAHVTYDDTYHGIFATGKGFNLKIDFQDDSLGIDLSVGFFLNAFKQKIVDVLKSELGKLV
ncbi:MAG: hypothetical protein HOE90_15845 [Bacteriovoracaceae bacterium]|nr:hypothetical protein [Bacteriovoracaceae bacterium]